MFDDGLLGASELFVTEHVLQDSMGGRRAWGGGGGKPGTPVPHAAGAYYFEPPSGGRAFYNSALMQALHYTRAQQLPGILAQRIAILDGAMGTMIQRFKLGEAQYRGEGYSGPDGAGDRFKDFARDVKGNNELLSLTRPDVIRDIHEAYLAAGADLIETNTFGATTVAQEDYKMAELAREMNLRSAQLARAACDKFSTPDKPLGAVFSSADFLSVGTRAA
eukprot:gene29873-36998_t